ncbi:hypothetical protein LJC26_05770 [Desulfovibrio sp. OttesenSCG-928-O18]|nr:hypothetical protein [Desulfovibrio sp. OttesenSCG-928-O18]
MSEVSRDSSADSCAIVDAPKVILALLLAVGALAAGGVCYFDGYSTAAYILITISVMLFWLFWVNKGGYVIDVENDVLVFPGGGVEAESWLSYFNPMYWLQGFRRHSVPLSEIREIDAYRDTRTNTYTDSKGKTHRKTTKTDVLEINGDFGAVRFSFMSKGKRDQLYSAIVQINEMGDPILKR